MASITTDIHGLKPDDTSLTVPVAYDHVTVDVGNVHFVLSSPDVAESIARTFWDAADALRAKQPDPDNDPDVARTLAIATGDDAA